MKTSVSSGGRRDGFADGGGIISPTFAKDGETSYLGRHPT